MTGTTSRRLIVQHTRDTLEFRRASSRAPLIVQHARADRRPYLHPLVAPDESAVLTEDAPAHHPWQHGLSIGLNDVNGVGFWTEGRHEPHRAIDGTFHPQPLRAAVVQGHTARWVVETEYRAPTGTALMDETQRWLARDDGNAYCLDLEWILRARIDIQFGRYDYGGLFLRMPWRADAGFTMHNSQGAKAREQIEAQRACWVAVSTGRAGIAIFDHPQNPEHPVPWRADNSFGFGPSRCIAGAWKLAAGESARLLHRVFVFTEPGAITESYRQFTEERA